METNTERVELIQQAARRLIEEEIQEDQRLTAGEDDADTLLSKLLLQLDTIQGNSGGALFDSLAPDEIAPEANDELMSTRTELSGEVAEEILKELKKVRRQNVVTHCLLSAMIVLTLVWQLSEVTLVLKVKRGLNNPFKAIGGMLQGLIKRRTKVHEPDESLQSSNNDE